MLTPQILKPLFAAILLGVYSYTANAQTTAVMQWFNPAKSNFTVTEGNAWVKETSRPYDRLPARAEKTVSPEVWKLSKNSAGMMIRFKTNAEQITVRYQVDGPMAMPHMPATGVSGIDLYATDADGKNLWAAGKYSFKDTVEYKFTNLKPVKTDVNAGIEYQLYMPLYNGVKWLEIGTPRGSSFTALPARVVKPIVVYGTSIAQGACASRPGMAWTAILSRKLNLPLINLGFSGTGRLDKVVVDLVNEIDARIYILDCLPNVVPGRSGLTESEVYSRIVNAVKQIRSLHLNTPIVLTDHFGYTDAAISPLKQAEGVTVNRINHQAFAALRKDGIKNIYILPQAALRQDMDTMVDGTHPTDLGMMRYAEAYQKLLVKMLPKTPAEK